MIFSVQRFVEDHLARRGLADVDDYAIQVANVFERTGVRAKKETLVTNLSRIRTAFFRRNSQLVRKEFEARLASALRRRFEKKKPDERFAEFEKSIVPARARLRAHRRSIAALLGEFQNAVEARAVDSFWISRKQHQLRRRPETIAQALLATFAMGVVAKNGFVMREFGSGIGFVDVGISFGGTLHLIELKILTGRLLGANQLASYMRLERRRVGWLLLVDSRRPAKRTPVPEQIIVPQGVIRTLHIDINPTPPHKT